MKKILKTTLYLLLSVLFFSSCNSYKKMAYLQTLNIADTSFTKAKTYYRLQPADQLYIKIKSLDPTVNALFNVDLGTSDMSMNSLNTMSGIYLMSFSIDFQGYINLPVFGKIKVAGLTLDEVVSLLETRANEYIKDARVDVKLVSFKVSVLGEVRNPGQQTIMATEASVFEVLARAGDISYYGNRKKIFIIRSFEKQNEVINIDLTNRNFLANPLFYMQPNDILYVEPLKRTAFRINLSDYSTIISAISSSIAVIVLITNLSNK